MALAATALKDMLSISIKPRHDSHSDQYNRIFMVKMFLVASVVTGLSWYADSINCIVPESHGVAGGFVSSTCWIQGVYVYRELKDRVDSVAYFGIPADIDMDGYLSNTKDKQLCAMNPRMTSLRRAPKKDPSCVPMEKTFYLQFQYMPFMLAALAILYYFPYVFFKTVNSDLISLKDHVKSEEPDAEGISKHYFDNRSNPQRNNRFRIILNIFIKILYLVSNLVAFISLNNTMNGDFTNYGSKWVAWSRLSNTDAHNYLGEREHPKPGNFLLPPFGYCEVYSSAKDIKQSFVNKHKYVCELSQYVLYQYVFMILWFALIFGIVASVLGIIELLVHYLIRVLGFKAHGPTGRRIFKLLSFREMEYLEYIRKKNIGLYGEVLDNLRQIKLGGDDNNAYAPNAHNTMPKYEDDQIKKRPEFDDY